MIKVDPDFLFAAFFMAIAILGCAAMVFMPLISMINKNRAKPVARKPCEYCSGQGFHIHTGEHNPRRIYCEICGGLGFIDTWVKSVKVTEKESIEGIENRRKIR